MFLKGVLFGLFALVELSEEEFENDLVTFFVFFPVHICS